MHLPDPLVVDDDTIAVLLTRTTFPAAGTPLACAVSGGADSLALVLLARAAGCAVEVHHVDHGLRAGSEAEAQFVSSFARMLGVAFHAHSVTVAPGPNIEARARAARYACLPESVATGHTADDLAETVLLHLVRGTGLDGITAMAAQRVSATGDSGTGHRLRLRPLLGLRRSETRALCEAIGIEPFDDPMNDDAHYQRVRMRTEVLPLLSDVANRDVVPLLARFAQLASDDVALLDALAGALDPTDAKAVAAAPVALARRTLRNWLRDHGPGEGYVSSLATVDRVLDVARGEAEGTEVGAGWQVRRRLQRLRLVEPSEED